MSRLKNLYHTTCRNRILEEKTTGKSVKLQMWTRKMERERYCELIECNMVICFFSWSLIQNHFPHKMHRIDLPCKVLRASALLCWAHLLSRWRALFLLRAAAAAPGPRTSNLPKRSFAWLHTAHTDKDFRSKEIVKAISASSVLTWPLLPTWGPANLTLDTARWWMREWRSSEASPKAPTTMPWTLPREPNLSSTGPTVSRGVPQYV